MTIELKPMGMKFRNPTTEEELLVAVNDALPEAGEDHREGRRYVKVSVELYVELMALAGFFAVNPVTGKTQLEEERA